MPATMATVNAILKEIYEPKIQEQLNDAAVTIKRIERTSEGVSSDVGGRYVTFGIHTRRNAGLGARNELQALPIPGQQGFNSGRVGLKYLYGGAKLSGQTFELADENFQAFASALDEEMSGLKDDLAVDLNRQVYGDGSGAIAVATATSTTAFTFTSLGNSTEVMYAQLGMMVDVIDGSTLANASPTVKASNRQVTAINVTTGVITVDTGPQGSGPAFSVAIGDILVRTDSVNKEWTGFAKIFANTGTLYNIDPNVEPLWKAEVDTTGGALSEGLMILMADRIRANGGKTTAIFCNLGVRRAYFNLLVQQRAFTNTKEFAGGFTGLTFTTDAGEIPVVVDIMTPKKRMYFVNEESLKLYREKDWSFMDRDGSKWQRTIGFDAYECMMYQYSELGCKRRNTNGLLDNITEG
jgi:hypothetical protein